MNERLCLAHTAAYSLSEAEIYDLLSLQNLNPALRIHLIHCFALNYLTKHYYLHQICSSDCRRVFHLKCSEVEKKTSNFEYLFFLFCLHKNGRVLCNFSEARSKSSGLPFFIRSTLEKAISSTPNFSSLYSTTQFKTCQKEFLTNIGSIKDIFHQSRIVLKRLRSDSSIPRVTLSDLLLK